MAGTRCCVLDRTVVRSLNHFLYKYIILKSIYLMNDSSSYELLALNSTRSSRQDAYITKFSEPSDAGRITSSSDLFVGLYCYEYNYDIRMHKRPAFDCTRGQYFPDFWDFSPGCPLLGALLSRRASSRSPDRTPAGGGLGRARVVSWGRAQSSKRRPYPLQMAPP